MSQIYINYSRRDLHNAYAVRDILVEAGFTVWLDETNIQAGDRWQDVIRQAVDDCEVVIVLMTLQSAASEWVNRTLEWGQEQNKVIIPILLEGQPFPSLTEILYLDAREGIASVATRLVVIVRRYILPIGFEPNDDYDVQTSGRYLYISYALRDTREQSQSLSVALREQGYTVWRDVDNLRAGDQFWEVSQEAMRQSAFLLALISPDVLHRTQSGVRHEIELAQLHGVPIIPLLVDVRIDELPVELRSLQSIDFNLFTQGLQALMRRLPKPEDLMRRGRIGRTPSSGTVPSDPSVLYHSSNLYDVIQRNAEDKLGVDLYAEAFARMVRTSLPPFTVGIYGKWGSGKTFLMQQIAAKLNREWRDGSSPPAFAPPTDANGKPLRWWHLRRLWSYLQWRWKNFSTARDSSDDPIVVWYDAWDYVVSDKLWSGLVERIFGGLERASTFSRSRKLRFNVERNLKQMVVQHRLSLWPLLMFGSLALLIVAGLSLFVEKNLEKLGSITVGLSLVYGIGRQLTQSASQRVTELFATDHYQRDINIIGRIRQDLAAFCEQIGNRMVVIFIDDLDRCEPNKAVEVLEAVKLLLQPDVSELAKSQFVAFIGLDARIITKAIEAHYGDVLKNAKVSGYEYLDKIVHVPFNIPDYPPESLLGYMDYLLEPRVDTPEPNATTAIPPSNDQGGGAGAAAHVSAPVPTGGTSQEPPATNSDSTKEGFTDGERAAFRRFNYHIDANPRRMKRISNVYRLVRSLLQQEPSTPLIDPLRDPQLIMGWLIICEQWPFAAYCMLEALDGLTPATFLPQLYTHTAPITEKGSAHLKALDMPYPLLKRLIDTHLNGVTCEQIAALRRYTVNFNPALSAEVRLTLMMAE